MINLNISNVLGRGPRYVINVGPGSVYSVTAPYYQRIKKTHIGQTNNQMTYTRLG